MPTDILTLNAAHAIPGILSFQENTNELISAHITNSLATGRVFLQGAHISNFQACDQEPLLWLSRTSFFLPQKAIRGGIPICWPWFGDHPDDPDKPAHGFARTALWHVTQTQSLADGATRICLQLTDTPKSRALWPHAFTLQLTITFSSTLDVALQITNTGNTPFTCSGALHSYLQVADCEEITIDGVDGCHYLDKVEHYLERTQTGALTLSGETDRIYLDTSAACTISDPGLKRSLKISKKGSNTTVVWNPGSEKSALMKDMDNSGYRTMVCVESVNTGEDSISLQPQAMHILGTTLEATAA